MLKVHKTDISKKQIEIKDHARIKGNLQGYVSIRGLGTGKVHVGLCLGLGPFFICWSDKIMLPDPETVTISKYIF